MGNGCTTTTAQNQSSTKKGGVLCFGHPLLDMMAPTTAEFLAEYGIDSGSVNLAQPWQVPLFDRLLEDGLQSVQYVPGGAAMNTARALAWMRPDMCVTYVGALGTDKFSTMLRSSLSTAGVHPIFEEHSGKPTGTCACLVLERDRTLVANLGAAVELSKAFMASDAVQTAVAQASVYYAEGFFLNTASSPNGLLAVAQHAKQMGKTFCFNLNAPYISAAFKDRIDFLMPFIDILFGSSEDIMAYAMATWPKEFQDPATSTSTAAIKQSSAHPNHNGVSGSDAASDTTEASHQTPPHSSSRTTEYERLSAAVARIAQMHTASGGSRLVVATCGADSTLIGRGADMQEYEVPPMKAEEMVDVNGAGDAFVAGFLAQYMLVKDAGLSAVVGHATAQNCIRHNGAVVSGIVPSLVQATS